MDTLELGQAIWLVALIFSAAIVMGTLRMFLKPTVAQEEVLFAGVCAITVMLIAGLFGNSAASALASGVFSYAGIWAVSHISHHEFFN